MDAKCAPVEEKQADILGYRNHTMSKDEPLEEDPNADLWKDFEFKRLAALYRLLKSEGYALRLTPL